jgi:hypothetical protein
VHFFRNALQWFGYLINQAYGHQQFFIHFLNSLEIAVMMAISSRFLMCSSSQRARAKLCGSSSSLGSRYRRKVSACSSPFWSMRSTRSFSFLAEW